VCALLVTLLFVIVGWLNWIGIVLMQVVGEGVGGGVWGWVTRAS